MLPHALAQHSVSILTRNLDTIVKIYTARSDLGSSRSDDRNPADFCAACRRLFLCWRCRGRCISHGRFPAGKIKDSFPSAERGTNGVQNECLESAGQDVEGRRLQGLHGGERYELYPHHPLFGRAVWELQLLQKSMCAVQSYLRNRC